MAAKLRNKPKATSAGNQIRKSKFQADLAPSDDSTMRALKAELQLTSNTDLLSDALALFRWAILERKQGHRIISESPTGERNILVLPRLERVAPDLALPKVEIRWEAAELGRLAELASGQPAQPTDVLIRAMRR